MRVSIKFRILITFYSSLPIFVIILAGMQTEIFTMEAFQLSIALGLATFFIIILCGPVIGMNWLFLKQFMQISKQCEGIRKGSYSYFHLPNQPLDEKDENEVVKMMRNMNWMTRQIAGRENELEDRVNQRTVELQKTNEELRVAKEEADASVVAKDLFLASMSHEIRTPMNAIMGLSELLSKTTLTNKQMEHLNIIRSSSEALLAIINAILDYSKINAGKFNLESIPFSICKTAQDVYNMFLNQADNKNIDLVLNLEVDLPKQVVGDPTRIRQVLINLVSNAVKFTEFGGVTISINCQYTSDSEVELVCQITDTGIGMTAETVKNIFEMFTQADSSTTRKYGGTGLGMAISQEIANLMKGTIRVESKLGKGSTFFFSTTLPYDNSEKDVLCKTCAFDSSCKLSKISPHKILVIDDNQINLQVAKELLDSFGQHSEIVTGGREALLMVQYLKYDLIFMDIQMADMDGYQTTRRMRKITGMQSVPIIAMTGNTMERDRKKALESGMDDFLTKPLKSDLIYHMIVKWTRQQFKNKHITTSAVKTLDSVLLDLSLPGIDIQDAKSRLGSATRVLPSLIIQFEENSQETIRSFREAIDHSDKTTLQFLLHKSKGAASNISATGLFQALDNLESGLKDEASQEKIREMLTLCEQGFEQINQAAHKIQHSQMAESVKKRALSEDIREQFIDVCHKLNTLYQDNSLTAKKFLIENEEILLHAGFDEEVKQLGQATRRFEFVEANCILESILQKIDIPLNHDINYKISEEQKKVNQVTYI